jgi:hypothetical protein
MDRFIKDPTGLTFADLQNNDWDLIELNITVDATSAMEWVNTVERDNQDSIWAWSSCDHLVAKDKLEKFQNDYRSRILQRTDTREPAQWMLQWYYQREGILPFIALACREQFPEILNDDFFEKWNTNLEKYFFGFWKKYYNALGPDVFEVARLVKFPSGCGLRPHNDTGPNQPFLIRMHTVPGIGENYSFYFGNDEGNERHYRLTAGKTYLLNTGIYHCAINHDDIDWWLLHNNPTPEAVTKLLNTTLHIE